jgi:hypothetical protein
VHNLNTQGSIGLSTTSKARPDYRMMSGILISVLAIPATVLLLYYGKQILKALEWMRSYWVLRHLPRPSGPMLGGYGSTIVGPHRHRVVTDLCEKFDGVFYYRNYYDQVCGPCFGVLGPNFLGLSAEFGMKQFEL